MEQDGFYNADQYAALTHAQLRYESSGRAGTLYFKNQETSFSMWWEFGGGDALAIINIPSAQNWETETQLALDKRAVVLQFIGEQVVRDQASGNGYYEIAEDFLTIYHS
jgi:hypothetical protein